MYVPSPCSITSSVSSLERQADFKLIFDAKHCKSTAARARRELFHSSGGRPLLLHLHLLPSQWERAVYSWKSWGSTVRNRQAWRVRTTRGGKSETSLSLSLSLSSLFSLLLSFFSSCEYSDSMLCSATECREGREWRVAGRAESGSFRLRVSAAALAEFWRRETQSFPYRTSFLC